MSIEYDDADIPDTYEVKEEVAEITLTSAFLTADKPLCTPVKSCSGFDWSAQLIVVDDMIMVAPKIVPVQFTRYWELHFKMAVRLRAPGRASRDPLLALADFKTSDELPLTKQLLLIDKQGVTKMLKDKNDHVTLIINFLPITHEGVYPRQRWPLSDRTNPLADTRVLVEGKALAVPRHYLSYHSEFFRALSYADFTERRPDGKDYVVIDGGLTFEELCEWLTLVLPGSNTITSTNIDAILRGARFLESQTAVNMVDDFLINDKQFSLARKFQLCTRFRLLKLQALFDHSLARLADCIDILRAEEYETFRAPEKLALLEYIRKASMDLVFPREPPLDA